MADPTPTLLPEEVARYFDDMRSVYVEAAGTEEQADVLRRFDGVIGLAGTDLVSYDNDVSAWSRLVDPYGVQHRRAVLARNKVEAHITAIKALMKTMSPTEALRRYYGRFRLSPNAPKDLRNMATRDYGPAGEKQRWLADWNADRDLFMRGTRVLTGGFAAAAAMTARYYYVMSDGRYQNERQAWADATGFGEIVSTATEVGTAMLVTPKMDRRNMQATIDSARAPGAVAAETRSVNNRATATATPTAGQRGVTSRVTTAAPRPFTADDVKNVAIGSLPPDHITVRPSGVGPAHYNGPISRYGVRAPGLERHELLPNVILEWLTGLLRGRGSISRDNPTMNIAHDPHADITTLERARGVGYAKQMRGRTVGDIIRDRAEVMLDAGGDIDQVRHFLDVATSYAKGLGIFDWKL